MLLLQDFPLQWRYARSVRSQAVEQARALVDSLGHHPSIVLWSAHNEPTLSSMRQRLSAGPEAEGARSRLRYVGRAAAAVVEQVRARPVGEAVASNVHDPTRLRGRPLRRRAAPSRSSTAPTATCRSGGATATAVDLDDVRRSPAEHGALRQRVRRRLGARPRPLHRRHARRGGLAGPRLGTARRRQRLRPRDVRTALPAEFVQLVRRVAQRHAVLPITRAQGADRGAAQAQVPPDRRLLLLQPRRPGPAGVVERARSRTGAEGRLRGRTRRLRSPARRQPSRPPTG